MLNIFTALPWEQKHGQEKNVAVKFSSFKPNLIVKIKIVSAFCFRSWTHQNNSESKNMVVPTINSLGIKKANDSL